MVEKNMSFQIMKFLLQQRKGEGDVVTASIEVRCPGYQMIAALWSCQGMVWDVAEVVCKHYSLPWVLLKSFCLDYWKNSIV